MDDENILDFSWRCQSVCDNCQEFITMNLNWTGKESSSQLGLREINLVLLKTILVHSIASQFAFHTFDTETQGFLVPLREPQSKNLPSWTTFSLYTASWHRIAKMKELHLSSPICSAGKTPSADSSARPATHDSTASAPHKLWEDDNTSATNSFRFLFPQVLNVQKVE